MCTMLMVLMFLWILMYVCFLSDAGVLVDDSWQLVQTVQLSFFLSCGNMLGKCH